MATSTDSTEKPDQTTDGPTCNLEHHGRCLLDDQPCGFPCTEADQQRCFLARNTAREAQYEAVEATETEMTAQLTPEQQAHMERINAGRQNIGKPPLPLVWFIAAAKMETADSQAAEQKG